MSDLITPGKHPAIFRGVSMEHSTNNKAEVRLGFELNGEGDPDAGRFITDFNYPEATELSCDIFVEKMRIVGYTGDDLEEFAQLARDGKLETQVELVIEHETYDGKARAKVKFVNRVGGGGLLAPKNPMTPQEVRSFATRMKARIRASTGVKRGSGGATAPRQPSLPSGGHPNAPGSGGGGGGWKPPF